MFKIIVIINCPGETAPASPNAPAASQKKPTQANTGTHYANAPATTNNCSSITTANQTTKTKEAQK